MIHLYSGDGKGKTSIAVGMSVRFAGAGGHVIFAQFMKGNESSELNILRKLDNVKVLKVEKEFGFYNTMTEQDKSEITELHNEILEEIAEVIEQIKRDVKRDNTCPKNLIVLDEITYPCRWKLIDEAAFKDLLKDLPECVEVVMTGRDPHDYMIESSDYWSDVEMKRHPFEKGIAARKGVEF